MAEALVLRQVALDYRLDRSVHHALKGIDLTVASGEFFTLLGPSGCGKTTALRSIAGLETPNHGAIEIGGKTVFSAEQRVLIPANRRPVSMVFQSYAIWPHMTVGENVAFPLEAEKLSRAERDKKVERALATVGLSAQLDRPASLLSGGQQQRVALARAIVRQSELLLLDEPLSNLDAKLREQMRFELRQIQQRLSTTAIYVTHDQDEALSMSDRIAVMRGGEVVEIGTPEQLYLAPMRRFTAEFLGQALIVPARRPVPAGPGTAVDTDFGTVVTTSTLPHPTSLAIRPEHVELSETRVDRLNSWPGKIAARSFSGHLIDYVVDVAGRSVPAKETSRRILAPGADVWVHLPPERCMLLGD
jgi:iron(III) transport system ATP-binding protein